MGCRFVTTQTGATYHHQCSACGRSVASLRAYVVRECTVASSEPAAARPKKKRQGVGSELHRLLRWFGQIPKRGCKCDQRIKIMDNNGVAWCEENVALIIGWLREGARERGLPFIEVAARRLVRLAIHRAKLKQNPPMPLG